MKFSIKADPENRRRPPFISGFRLLAGDGIEFNIFLDV